MQLSFKQTAQLLDYLVAQHKKRGGLNELENAMEQDYQIGAIERGEKISLRSMQRILEAAEEPEESSTYSASRLFDALNRYDKPTVGILYKYLMRRNFLEVSKSTDFISRLQEFLRTSNDAYSQHHLDSLIGDYYMYRRCWFRDDGKTYMRSFVRIRCDNEPGVYEFSEVQIFKAERISEVSKGYLFLSGQSVVALCNAENRSTVKFLSITQLFPSGTEFGEPAESFSGNGIASSDYPPHVGYGFHCERVADEDDPLDDDQINCEIFGFSRLKKERVDILNKIIEYDGFKYVNFEPKERI